MPLFEENQAPTAGYSNGSVQSGSPAQLPKPARGSAPGRKPHYAGFCRATSFRINDVTLRESDTVQSLLTFGASSILGRGTLVDLQVEIGLTNAAPKYSVILSSTYRFGRAGALSLINWPKRVG